MKTSTLTKLFSTAAVVGALATPALSQEEGITIPGASAEVTLDYVTQYFFRGYEQFDSDTGVVIQPGASLTIPVVEGVTATVGTWASLHSDLDASVGQATREPDIVYETDIYASLDAELGDFAVSVSLTHFNYPALVGANDVVELGLGVGYDDSELLGDFAFNPYIYVGIELNNTNSNNAGGEATYLEVGGAFSLNSLTEGTFAEVWDWSVPFAIGMSLDDYYNDNGATPAEEFLGFVSVGLAGSVPMSELIGTDEYVGAWSLNVGVSVLFLNSDVTLTDNRDDTSDNMQIVGTVGISREW